MIDVSELYKENIYKEDSELCCKVEVYFDEIPDVFDDKIFSISMIEELNIESGVVAKECIISFINNDDVFTPTDKEGPFYGLIKPNVKIRPFIGVVVNDEPEYVPLGTYFVEEWVPSGILMNVKCYDILYNLQDKESPKTRIKKDVTLYEYTSNFMELLGCEYVITDRLKKVQLQYPYYGKTIGETLKNISIAGNCFIFIDRYDRVIVKNKTYEEQKEVEWNMTEEHIYSVDNPQDYKKIYSGIEIESKMPNISKSQKVLEIDDFEVEKGSADIDLDLINQ